MQEYWLGHNVVGFDGIVLELFGATDVHRCHLYHIQSFQLSRTRSGRLSLYVHAQGGRGTPSVGDLDESALPAVEALVEAVNGARQARGWPLIPFRTS